MNISTIHKCHHPQLSENIRALFVDALPSIAIAATLRFHRHGNTIDSTFRVIMSRKPSILSGHFPLPCLISKENYQSRATFPSLTFRRAKELLMMLAAADDFVVSLDISFFTETL